MRNRIAGLVLALFAFIGLSFGGSVASADPGPPQDCTLGQSQSSDGSCQDCWYLTGCYHSANEMADLVAHAQKVYLDNLKIVFGSNYSLLHGFTKLVPSGQSVNAACELELSDGQKTHVQTSLTAQDFCTVDRTVYIGMDFAWRLYQRYGPLAVVQLDMHELTHSVQESVGITFDDQSSVDFEDQADCGSGAGIGYLNTLVSLQVRDIGDVNAYFATVLADNPDRPGGNHHGTYLQRLGSFMLGYTAGEKSCNTIHQPLVP